MVAATVCEETDSDSTTLVPSLVTAQANLIRAGSDIEIRVVPADKAYHANQTLLDAHRLT